MLYSDRSRTLAFFAQDPRPDIASVSGRRHSWHKTLTTDVTRSKLLRSQQLRTRKGTRNKICLHCLRTTKKTSGTDGKTKTLRCAGPAHQQKDVLASTNKTVHLETGATGSCVNTRTCKGLSVHVRCRFTITIKTLLHVFARCIFKRTLYHIGYVATLYFAECGSVRTNN